MRSSFVLVRASSSEMTSRYFETSESKITRITSTSELGTHWPVSRQKSRMRVGTSPGAANLGSLTSTVERLGREAAAPMRVFSSNLSPVFRHSRIDSWANQSPVTFFRKRVRPSTPHSLVKFAANASGVRIGLSSSTPSKLQVPLEMKSEFGSVLGTATKADAVSCEPTVTTLVLD
jgi:hypothetical protein